MQIPQEIKDWQDEFIQIRHFLHQHPEIGLQERQTADFIANKLSSWGYEVHAPIGPTGVVGQIKKGHSDKKIGLRADMDCLPIQEETDLPYASQNPGFMHACGHDGHMTVLLAAARYLALKPNFDGTLNVIFQPGEEGLHGAPKMIADGLFDKFPCDQIFGFHNWPNFQKEMIYIEPGVIMASSDRLKIVIQGHGGHASAPDKCLDPTIIGSQLINNLQTIVSRNVNPQKAAVITVGSFVAGDGSTYNVIPDTATILLSIRTLDKKVRQLVLKRVKDMINGLAQAYDVPITIKHRLISLPAQNEIQATTFAQKVAQKVFGNDHVNTHFEPVMASEDFAFMLDKVPGCYALMSNGPSDAYLHSSRYNFNDSIIAPMATYFIKLVETYLG